MSLPDETPEAREVRLQRILKQIEERLRQSLPNPQQPLEQIEQEVYEIGEAVREVIERETLQEGPSPQATLPREQPCRCGKPARYVGHRGRQVVTRNGVHLLSRAYYHCRACQRGFCPQDGVWQLGRDQCSVGVRALLARFAAYLPYRTAAREMAAICGIDLCPKTIARQAQAVGRVLEQDWQQAEQRLWRLPEPQCPLRPSQLHVTMDGVMIQIGAAWKEVKVVTVYQTDKEEGGVQAAAHYATLAASAAFGKRVRTLAHACGADNCRQVAVVADGAEWIWQETGKYFPRRVQIVDYYHVVQHLWEVAHVRFGQESVSAQAWIDRQQECLLNNRVDEVIADIGSWNPKTQADQEVRRKVSQYLFTHQRRLQYKTFREQGYHIGSGVAEAACKSVVQARFKQAGMRWSETGAEAMLHLRAAWCSSDFTDFQQAARQINSPSLS